MSRRAVAGWIVGDLPVGIAMRGECDLRPSLIKCAACPSFKRIDNDTRATRDSPDSLDSRLAAALAGGSGLQE